MKPSRRHLNRIAFARLYASLALSAGLASALPGCQMEPGRDLGLTQERALPVTAPEPAIERFGMPLSEFSGRWVGTVEDPLALGGERKEYVFPSGATSIRLDIAAPDDGGRHIDGTLVFGDGGGPPPPSDPDQGYPTDVDYVGIGYFNSFFGTADYIGPLPPYEGFAYQVRDAFDSTEISGRGVADGILRLSYDAQEVLAPWCELQQPQSDGNGGFKCVGGTGHLSEAGQCSNESNNLGELLAGLTDAQIQALSAEDWAAIDAQIVRVFEPVDCDKLFLCNTQRCRCDESSCRADVSDFRGVAGDEPNSSSYAELTLRKTADGLGLIGLFDNAVFANERQLSVPVGVVHFQRVE